MFDQNTYIPQPSSNPLGNSADAIRPSFLPRSAATVTSQPNSFAQMSPMSQRAALYDQARHQAVQQARFSDPRANLSSMLPGGLTERQRMDFESLRRTNPIAAQKQLDLYQRNADIRYNRPASGVQSSVGRSIMPSTNHFNGPRRSFGL
ncbi:hypothetical protein KDA06_03045 [Candidatus Saccharibacteria bacterium]|nr:hypothetical protein [Candidatus Saccharibacteria bacterium]